jgi:hypothetical protein
MPEHGLFLSRLLLMTSQNHLPKSLILLASTALLATAFAGCTGPGEEPIDMEAFEAAMAAPGETYTPDEMSGGTDFRVKLLEPEDPEQARMGEQPLVLLVYDTSDEPMPVVDAVLDIDPWMTEHTHTWGEGEAEHTAGGVYEGDIYLIMAGYGELRINGQRENGDSFRLTIDFVIPE